MENLLLLHLVLNKRSACWLLAGASLAPFQGQRASARQLAGPGLAAVWRAARLPGLPGCVGDLSLISPHSHQPR